VFLKYDAQLKRTLPLSGGFSRGEGGVAIGVDAIFGACYYLRLSAGADGNTKDKCSSR